MTADLFEGAWFVLPARGGSKGVPRKVLRHLAGKPLILHSLQRLSTRLPSSSPPLSSICEKRK